MAKTKPHQRVNDILLGPLERPALHWLAAHQPSWMTPDILTGIGVLGAVIIFVSYALTKISPAFLWLASFGFVVNWFGDSLDGTLARYRKIERPQYGFFVDHTVDSFNEMLIVLGLGVSPYVRFDIAALALIGYLLMSVLVYIRTYVQGVFQISYGKLGPTEARVIVVIVNAAIYFFGNPTFALPLGTFSVFDLVAAAAAALLLVLYVANCLRQARELARQEQSAAS